MKRSLLIIALGVVFLIFMTWIGTFLDSLVLHRTTAQVQSAQAGPYHITFQVNSNPPLVTKPATLSIQVLVNATQQPLTDAHVTLMSNMETMDMGLNLTEAQSQGNGMYLVMVQFPMSGPWRIQVMVSKTGEKGIASATFEVTAQ